MTGMYCPTGLEARSPQSAVVAGCAPLRLWGRVPPCFSQLLVAADLLALYMHHSSFCPSSLCGSVSVHIALSFLLQGHLLQ